VDGKSLLLVSMMEREAPVFDHDGKGGQLTSHNFLKAWEFPGLDRC
jgi:hypothetical protein